MISERIRISSILYPQISFLNATAAAYGTIEYVLRAFGFMSYGLPLFHPWNDQSDEPFSYQAVSVSKVYHPPSNYIEYQVLLNCSIDHDVYQNSLRRHVRRSGNVMYAHLRSMQTISYAKDSLLLNNFDHDWKFLAEPSRPCIITMVSSVIEFRSLLLPSKQLWCNGIDKQ